MRVFKVLLLVLLGVATVGFGLCGAWGVVVDWQNYMNGCKGNYACLGWVAGWIGLGIAAVSFMLYWVVHRFMPPKPGAKVNEHQGPPQP